MADNPKKGSKSASAHLPGGGFLGCGLLGCLLGSWFLRRSLLFVLAAVAIAVAVARRAGAATVTVAAVARRGITVLCLFDSFLGWLLRRRCHLFLWLII